MEIEYNGEMVEVENLTNLPDEQIKLPGSVMPAERVYDECHYSDWSIWRYYLGDDLSLWVCDGEGVTAHVEVDTADDHEAMCDVVLAWEHWDCPDAMWLAAWDLDGMSILTVADEEYAGPCNAWRQDPVNRTTSEYATECDEDNDVTPIRFASYTEAREWIDRNDDTYGDDSWFVVKAGNGLR